MLDVLYTINLTFKHITIQYGKGTLGFPSANKCCKANLKKRITRLLGSTQVNRHYKLATMLYKYILFING